MRIDPRSFKSFLSFSLAVVAMASVACTATAQRAPELLPAQVTLVAGGGSALVSGKCPISGNTATDTAGDGCLATEIILGTATATPGPRWAVADSKGNVFFSDYANNLIRRVDALTGVVTAVAGGAASTPGVGTVCGTAISVDALGDGCLGTAVKLLHPTGLAFAPNGDLYFSEADYVTGTTGGAHVRKISATSGFITTSGTISLILGQASNAKGYAANVSTCTATVATGCITAANSYLYAPYGLSTDAAGNLYVVEEYKEALLVYNPATTGSVTINTIPVPAGTVAKLVGGYGTSGTVQDCPNAPATTNGCTYGLTTFGGPASKSLFDSTYALAPDALGNLYFSNEYYNYVGKVSTSGILTQFAGIQNAAAKNLTRATAGTNGIGSSFGIATDQNSNIYFTDASSGVIWRVDADTSTQYVIAGGATTVCTAGDAYGNGCPATQATFGKSGSGNYATTTLPGPGVYGVSVDAYGNLFTGDTETNEVREVGTGAQFGAIGNTQPTNTLIVHYAPGDGPASSTPYVISTGANNFALGTPGACTTNSDNSKDCPVPVQATPSVLGAFTGTLTVTSALNKTANFPLSGTFVSSRITRTAISFSAGVNCTTTGTPTYSSSTPITLTATISSTGTPTGTVQFYNGSNPVGSPATVTNGVATLTATFPVGSYAVTATYSGDNNFNTSTSASSVKFNIATASFSLAATTYQSNTVPAGGTALYSFTVPMNVYTGTVTFSCSGLPAGASCVFSPTTLTGTGCSLTGTSAPVVAMSIYTSVKQAQAGFGGRWMMLTGFALALMLGLNRRRMTARFAQLSIMLALLLAASGLTACSTSSIGNPSTPSGTSTVTVVGAGSDGSVQTLTVTLTVQ